MSKGFFCRRAGPSITMVAAVRRQIALVVTPDGFPLGYEVLPGNTADCTTLRDMLRKIESQYGKANRVWVMDRGIPSEEVLAEMRATDPPVSYLVATPKGRLSKLEKRLVTLPWQAVREGGMEAQSTIVNLQSSGKDIG